MNNTDGCAHLKTGFALEAMRSLVLKFQKENQQRRQSLLSTVSCKMCKQHQSDMWLCTVCCDFYCGRSNKEHTYSHRKETKHPIFLKIEDMSLWCYSCNSFIDSYGKTSRAFTLISKLRDVLSCKKLQSTPCPPTVAVQHTSNPTSTSVTIQRYVHPSSGSHQKLIVLHGAAAQSAQRAMNHKASLLQLDRAIPLRYVTKPEMSDDEFCQPSTSHISHFVKGKSPPLLSTLVNLGNTCYINSIIQVLSHISHFARYFLALYPCIQKLTMPQFSLDMTEGNRYKRMLMEFSKVMMAMQSTVPEVISPNKFVKSWKKLSANTYYRNDAQHDSSDFMLLLFEQLGLSLAEFGYKEIDIHFPSKSSSKNISLSPVYLTLSQMLQETVNQKQIRTVIDDIFEGTMMTQTKCSACDYEVKKFERFLQLSVPIVDGCVGIGGGRKQYELTSLLRNYLNPKQSFDCQKCGRRTCVQSSQIVVLPEILIIQFQRLTITGSSIRIPVDPYSASTARANSNYNSPENSIDESSDNTCHSTTDGIGAKTCLSSGGPPGQARKREETKITKITQTIQCEQQGLTLDEFLASSSVHLLNDTYSAPPTPPPPPPRDIFEEPPPPPKFSDVELLLAKYGGYTYDLVSTVEHTGGRSSGHYQAKVRVSKAPSHVRSGREISQRDFSSVKLFNTTKNNNHSTTRGNPVEMEGGARDGNIDKDIGDGCDDVRGINDVSMLRREVGDIRRLMGLGQGRALQQGKTLTEQNGNDKGGDGAIPGNVVRSENMSSKGTDDEWYLFSDRDKRRIDRNQILSPNTYLLFFKKQPTELQLRVRAKSIRDTQTAPANSQPLASAISSFTKTNRAREAFDLDRRIKPSASFDCKAGCFDYHRRYGTQDASSGNGLNEGYPRCGSLLTRGLDKFNVFLRPSFPFSTAFGGVKPQPFTHLISGEWLYRLHTMKYPGPINYNCLIDIRGFDTFSNNKTSRIPSLITSPSLRFASSTRFKINEAIVLKKKAPKPRESQRVLPNPKQTIQTTQVTNIIPPICSVKTNTEISSSVSGTVGVFQPTAKSYEFVKLSTLLEKNAKKFLLICSDPNTIMGYDQEQQEATQSSQSSSYLQDEESESDDSLKVKYSMLYEYDFNPLNPSDTKPDNTADANELDTSSGQQQGFNRTPITITTNEVRTPEETMDTGRQTPQRHTEESMADNEVTNTDKSPKQLETHSQTPVSPSPNTYRNVHTSETMNVERHRARSEFRKAPPNAEMADAQRRLMDASALEAVLKGIPSTVSLLLPSRLSVQFPAFVPLSGEQFNTLVSCYGLVGKRPLVMKDILGMDISQKQVGRAQLAILRQVELALEGLRQSKMCAASSAWLHELARYFNSCFSPMKSSSVRLPPSFTNRSLVTSSDVLRRDIAPVADYVLIAVPVFYLLCKWFTAKGDPCFDIRCKKVEKDTGLPILVMHNKHPLSDDYNGPEDELVLM